MFRVRAAREDDADALHGFALEMNFLNLPKTGEAMREKTAQSVRSFLEPSAALEENCHIFVLEDMREGRAVGCSLVHGKHGTEASPHLFLRAGEERRRSGTLGVERTLRTLTFGHETDGHTEIGGLFLSPALRGSGGRLGKQLSYARFLYMGMNPGLFTERVHVELLPPFDEKGGSPLWDAVGRPFTGMDYREADALSQSNKEFIISLFPKGPIYLDLLPRGAREVVGRTGPQSLPVKAMLEKAGFRHAGEIDPFDGGPHYRAPLRDLAPVRGMRRATVRRDPAAGRGGPWMAAAEEGREWSACVLEGELRGDELASPDPHPALEEGARAALLPF